MLTQNEVQSLKDISSSNHIICVGLSYLTDLVSNSFRTRQLVRQSGLVVHFLLSDD